MDPLDDVFEAVLDGDLQATPEHVQATFDAAVPAATILQDGLVVAMDEVGRLFEEGQYFVPEMLLAARAMKAGLAVLKPHLGESAIASLGRVVVGTVQGDVHDIGKDLVAMMLDGAGFEVVDLGTDVDPERFVDAAEEGADILGFSALLTTTLPSIAATIQALEDAGVRDRVKIMAGGAPVTAAFARHVGADGYAPDASQAVAVAKSLMAAT